MGRVNENGDWLRSDLPCVAARPRSMGAQVPVPFVVPPGQQVVAPQHNVSPHPAVPLEKVACPLFSKKVACPLFSSSASRCPGHHAVVEPSPSERGGGKTPAFRGTRLLAVSCLLGESPKIVLQRHLLAGPKGCRRLAGGASLRKAFVYR